MSEKHYHEDHFQTRQERRESRARKKSGGGALEFFIILAVSFALVFGFVKPYVLEAFWIPSESMVPTLEVHDRVLTNKFIYDFTEPDRGDIVVFQSVEGGGEVRETGLIGQVRSVFGAQESVRPELIKRVVGVPGDVIKVRRGRLFVNGELQTEPYVNKVRNPELQASYGPKRIPPGHVFVMGDNRTNSRDSRFFGPVPYKNIEGKAFLLFWPISRLELL
jgi:signal peptidase I